MRKFTTAVIVAAGNSTRMGLKKSKQLITINGKPAIEHTLTAFDTCDVIDEIVVVCRDCDMSDIKAIADKFPKVSAVITGGDTRLLSVKNGIMCASDKAEFFAIHDGARMLVTHSDIRRVVERAFVCNCATLGTAVTDTIKVVSKDNAIVSTPDRSTLMAVQTPQVFEKELYMRAMQNAVDKNLSVTDDCSMVEAIGERVEVVLGSNENIKLTTQTDIMVAQAFLSCRDNSNKE